MNYFTVLSAINGIADALEFVYDALECFCQHFIAICVLLYVAGEFTGRGFYEWHANWVGTIEYNAPAAAVVAAPVAPAVNPLFVEAAAIEAAYSVRTLQATFGVRKARLKYQQIGSFIAR